MDHDLIDQFDFADRYLMGRLTADESSRFEEHFVDCPLCINRLRTTENFLMGLRATTIRQASPGEANGSKGVLRAFSQVLSAKRLALAWVCLIVVAALGAVGAVRQIRRLRFEVDQAKEAAAQRVSLLEQERQSADESNRERQAIVRDLTAKIRQLEAMINSREGKHAGTSPGPSTEPIINLPAVALTSVRGNPNSPQAIDAVALRGSSITWFLISLALEGEGDSKDYCVTIVDDHKKLKWKKCGFKPDQNDYLSLLANSRLLRPGSYHLIVEGVTNGVSRIIGEYPLSIVKKS